MKRTIRISLLLALGTVVACGDGTVPTGGGQTGADAASDGAGSADVTEWFDAAAPTDASGADGAVADTGTAPPDGASVPDGGEPGDTGHPDCTAEAGLCMIGAFDPKTGECTFAAAPDGTACDDGLACTEDDACGAGVCAGVALSCDDNLACSVDSCDEATGGCAFDKSGCGCQEDGDCDDGNPCNGIESCDQGAHECMAGEAVDCGALAGPCVTAECDPGTGECQESPLEDGAACDDGNACTQADSCQGGECKGAEPVVCEGGDACHELLPCDPATGLCGVVKAPDGSVCDDGDACTQKDECIGGDCKGGDPVVCPVGGACNPGGACDPQTGTCPSEALPDGAVCDDASVCTEGDTCQGGLCVGVPVDCDDGIACTLDTCDEGLGGCIADWSPCPCVTDMDCNDGNPCNGEESCVDQACAVGTPVVCSGLDGPCTTGVCDPATGGCATTPKADGAPCDDGNLCTLSDSCQGGKCAGSSKVKCAAADGCHTPGTCDPATGTCTSPAVPDGVPCSDGDACTKLDTCVAGACTGGTSVVCTATDSCHDAGVCDPGSGKCSSPVGADGTPCDDGDVCTDDDVCAGGTCQGAAHPCDDGIACTVDYCDANQGGCTSDPAGCSCNDDIDCDDGNPCNGVETCDTQTLQCQAGTPPDCSVLDGACAKGVCQAATGECAAIPVAQGTPCDDGNACTQADGCKAGVCVGSDPVACGKGSQCQDVGVCDPATGACSQPLAPNGTPCDDGNACTVGDTCVDGACKAGTATECESSGPCFLAGVCDTGTGKCSTPTVPEGTPCDDGSACTTSDVCQGGSCVGGAPKKCVALDACHLAGTCDPGTGVCSAPPAPDGAPCSDGNGCTLSDACSAGSCKGGAPVVCSPPSQCHLAGTCAPATGKCTNPLANNGKPCDDGNVCTDNDVCGAGTCSGAPHPCNDGIACTKDSCDPGLGGCTSDASTCACTVDADCDDGNACNGAETCDKATLQCKSGTAKDCSGMTGPCATGACDPSTGQCKAVPVSDGKLCDDGDACTLSDGCKAGACVGSNPVVCTKAGACLDVGTCNPATGQCSKPAVADGTPCDDGNACTKSDTCLGGVCKGANPVQCTALDPCHLPGTCDVSTGKCSNPVKGNGTACDDANACTKTDTCQDGTCKGSNPVVCPAASQCKTEGVCIPATGACSQTNLADGTTCSDGNACTVNDVCKAGGCSSGPAVECTAKSQCHLVGVCSPTTGQCSNPVKPAGSTCEDGDLCTQGDGCDTGTCKSGTAKTCSSPPVCHDATTCNPKTGTCDYPAIADGKACNDGLPCTLSDKCVSGKCAGTPIKCINTKYPCEETEGQCVGNGECEYDVLADGTPCDDGDPCTVKDLCASGSCKSQPMECPPSSAQCKVAVCKAGVGVCVDVNASNGLVCDDGDVCTTVDKCQSGVCVGQGTLTNATGDYAVRVGTTAGPSGVNMIRRWDGSVGLVGAYGATTTFASGLTLVPPSSGAVYFVTWPAGKSVPTTAKTIAYSDGDIQVGAVSNSDGDGGFVVVGSFNGKTTFGAGAASVTFDAGLVDVFAAYYDVNGTLKWARTGSGGGLATADAVVIAWDGSVLVVGSNLLPITFNSGAGSAGTSVSGGGTYLARWGKTGSLALAVLFADELLDHLSFASLTGDVALVGSFSGTVKAGAGSSPAILKSAGSTDAVLMRIKPSDATVVQFWVAGGTEADFPFGVISLPFGGADLAFGISAGPSPSLRSDLYYLGLHHLAGTGKRDIHVVTVNASGSPITDALIGHASQTQEGLALTTHGGFQGFTVVGTTDGNLSMYGAAGLGSGAPANAPDFKWLNLTTGPKRMFAARFDYQTNFIWAANAGAIDAGIGKYQGWGLDAIQHSDLSVSICGMFDKTATFGDAKPTTLTPFPGGSPFLMLMNSEGALDLCP